jgi:hypothetical protein
MDYTTTAVVAAVPLVLALLSGGALAVVEPGEIRYARLLRWFSLLGALVPPLGILAILSFVQKRPLRPDERVPVVLLMLLFPGLSLPLVLEFFRVHHRFDDAGLSFRSPWTKHRRIAWTDIASVQWGRFAKWLNLKTHAGANLHLSPVLAGLKPFANQALARIPSVVLAAHPEGRAVLQLMAAGRAGELVTSPLSPEKLFASREPRDPAGTSQGA